MLFISIISIFKIKYTNSLELNNIEEIQKYELVIEKSKELRKERVIEFKEEKKINNFIENIDFKKDNSLTKFINNKIPFDEKSYIPEKLISISSEYIYDTKWNWKLREIANEALQNMWEDFYKIFFKKLSVISSYRSYQYQKWIKNRWCPDNLCAKAGYSEHQSWLAIDFFSASNNYTWKNDLNLQKYYAWFDENAQKYGFTNTYQKWLEIDWYEIEPWHWRYVWEELALYLKNNNLTFAEFYKINRN